MTMKKTAKLSLPLLFSFGFLFFACSKEDIEIIPEVTKAPDFQITEASAIINDYEQVVMSVKTKGTAGNTYPTGAGKPDGAPVLGYVFPTTLKSSDVGFGDTEGIVAMAITSHPDFDDTPLWDENNDKDFLNDGKVWHAHWVVLTEDSRVQGGLSVKEFEAGDEQVVLPPTNPGMPMYMDSPGFHVVQKNGTLRVVIPLERINNQRSFNFDAVSVYMQVNTSDASKPMLGVYEVYSILSGDLSLPYSVK